MIINCGTISTMDASTAVAFDIEHDKTPHVVISSAGHAVAGDNVNVYASNVTTKGFTLELSADVGLGITNKKFDYQSVST